jgi:predicted aldo/keto reductase-like oxidoreductase
MDCPRGVDIPGVIGVYNNYNQMGKYKKASLQDFLFRYGILGVDKQAHHCIRCNQCLRRCPQHINIPHWMKTINGFYKKINILTKPYRIMKNVINRIKKDGIIISLKYYSDKFSKNKKNST